MAWVLIVYAGSHGGYYTVPNIASEAACRYLYEQVRAEGYYVPALTGKSYLCLQYPAAK